MATPNPRLLRVRCTRRAGPTRTAHTVQRATSWACWALQSTEAHVDGLWGMKRRKRSFRIPPGHGCTIIAHQNSTECCLELDGLWAGGGGGADESAFSNSTCTPLPHGQPHPKRQEPTLWSHVVGSSSDARKLGCGQRGASFCGWTHPPPVLRPKGTGLGYWQCGRRQRQTRQAAVEDQRYRLFTWTVWQSFERKVNRASSKRGYFQGSWRECRGDATRETHPETWTLRKW